jgi:hypothetical protein
VIPENAAEVNPGTMGTRAGGPKTIGAHVAVVGPANPSAAGGEWKKFASLPAAGYHVPNALSNEDVVMSSLRSAICDTLP